MVYMVPPSDPASIDMHSGLLDSRQRPFPERARNNEPWGVAFDIYGGPNAR